MEARKLPKRELAGFLEMLKGKSELIAPIQKGSLRFSKVEDVGQVVISGHPLFSLKMFYFPPKRKLFSYKGTNITEEPLPKKKLIIFGARLCDINAILRTDHLFSGEFADPYYENAKKNITLIGINCETVPKPDQCFCSSQGLEHRGYDLFFCDNGGDDFDIVVGTDKGRELVKHLPETDATPKPIDTPKKLYKKDISAYYNHPDWKKEADKCISCGACTNLCATCMCYDIFDDPDLDMESGSRNLQWDSCQYTDFTKVAGNHVFRDTREARLKHRIYHKLKYFPDKFGVSMCTGCGRCIEGCPTGIDFVKTLNNMK